MTYRVIFGGGAVMQYHELPESAPPSSLAPSSWPAHRGTATVLPPGDDPAFRQTTFGDGLGLLSFHVGMPLDLVTPVKGHRLLLFGARRLSEVLERLLGSSVAGPWRQP